VCREHGFELVLRLDPFDDGDHEIEPLFVNGRAVG
jgi:hypothetical protein